MERSFVKREPSPPVKYCRKCFYQLDSSASLVCPECGSKIDLEDPHTFRTCNRAQLWRKRVDAVLGVILVLWFIPVVATHIIAAIHNNYVDQILHAGGAYSGYGPIEVIEDPYRTWLSWFGIAKLDRVGQISFEAGPGFNSAEIEAVFHKGRFVQEVSLDWHAGLGLNDKAMSSLAELPELNTLYLLYGRWQAKDMLVSLPRIAHLEHLEVQRCHLSHEDLANIAACPNITYLSLLGSTFPSEDLRLFAKLKKLNLLNLIDTNADDSAFIGWKNSSLVFLYLNGTQTKLAGLHEILQADKALGIVTLHGTPLHADEIDACQKLHPMIELVR